MLFGLIKLAILGGGLYVVSKELERKRKKEPTTGGEHEEPHVRPEGPGGVRDPKGRPSGPGGVQQEEPHIEPVPDDWNDRYQKWYVAAADSCLKRVSTEGMSYNEAVGNLMACSLEEIFPEAVWPPPPEAHQWQRNLWAPAGGMYGDALLDYIENQLKVGNIPG